MTNKRKTRGGEGGGGGGGSSEIGGGSSLNIKKNRTVTTTTTTTAAVAKPRDALVVETIPKQMGAERFEPRVVNQALEFVYRYVGDVLEEAKAYQRHRIGYGNEQKTKENDGGKGGGEDGQSDASAEELKNIPSRRAGDGRLASRVILSREFAANDIGSTSTESLQKA